MVAYVTLPSWVPDGHKQAPLPLLVVQSFVNTRDLDLGTDVLAGPGPASTWLRAAGLLGADASVTAAGLAAAREVRESIRVLLAGNSNRPAASPGAAGARAAPATWRPCARWPRRAAPGWPSTRMAGSSWPPGRPPPSPRAWSDCWSSSATRSRTAAGRG